MIKGKKLRTLLLYTLIFAAAALGMAMWVVLSGKSTIWSADGIQQHYPALIYYSEWLKNGMNLWDFSIGFGSDVLTSLNYYCIGDPLALICAFFNADNMHICYTLLIVLRLYLSGLAFLGVCSRFKLESVPSIAGALMYSLCCYGVYVSMRHPFFVNAMIYLPLIIWGMEKLLHRENAALFVFAVAITAVSNFTFLTVITFSAVFYAVIRYLSLKDKLTEPLPHAALRCAGWYLLGLAIAAVIFLPALLGYLGSGRTTESQSKALKFYDFSFYGKALASIFSSKGAAGYTWMGFAAIALPASVIFLRRPYKCVLKIGYVILYVLVFIPAFGWLMSGMSYVVNRWIYVLAFASSLVTAMVLPDLLKLKFTEKLLICGAACVYFMICLMVYQMGCKKGIPAAMLLMIVSIILLLPKGNAHGWKSAASIFVICVCLVSNFYYNFSTMKSDYLEKNENWGEEITAYTETASAAASEIDDESFYRVDVEGTSNFNEGMIQGFNSTSSFFSVTSKYVTEYFYDLGIASQSHMLKADGLDGRASLNALSSVKYEVAEDGKSVPVIYGTNLISQSEIAGVKYNTYENRLALPLGYTYESSISKEEYDALTIAQKQQAMMQSIVLENGGGGNPVYSDVTVPYSLILPAEGVRINEDGDICVIKKNSAVTLVFDGLEQAETYLNITGLKLTDKNPYSSETEPKRYKKWKKPGAKSNCVVEGENVSTKLVVRNHREQYYFGQENYMINMGYSESGQTYIKITFDKVGVYEADMSVVCQPMSSIETQVQSLRADALENVNIGKDTVTGCISLDKMKYLCLTIPYSKGWKAEVDGESAELLNANGMYSALELEAGEHEIKLTYFTPGLKAGAVISIAALALSAILFGIGRKKRGKADK